MSIFGGYKTLSPIQISNGLGALRANLISYRTFRSYLALFEMKARREAAARARVRKRRRIAPRSRYTLFELQCLTGARDEASVKRDVRRLERLGLVRLTERELKITDSKLPFAETVLELACIGRRSKTRPIPIPRPILCYLAACRRPSLAKAFLALAIRGLSIDRRSGAPKGRGTAKASWIAEFAGLSLRGAKFARAQLIELGWVSRDQGSHQWKLNRDGAYFVVNFAWGASARRRRLAPPVPTLGTGSAPPIVRQETPYGSKTRNCLGSTRQPSIRNVRTSDLSRFSRMESLYWQAERDGLIKHSESAALSFIAAAVRAREVGDDPPRVFSAIVRRGLWSHISGPQEDHARRALARYRENVPRAFRREVAA